MADELTEALAAARRRLGEAVERLRDGAVPDEVVAERVVPRPILGVARPARLRELGRAWRLGVLLLGRDGGLRAVGTTFRSGEPAHSATRSRLAEERLELQRAARRGRIRDAQTVNVDAPLLDLSAPPAAPLMLRERELFVLWARGADPAPFARYLDEQLELRLHPPTGAGETPRQPA